MTATRPPTDIVLLGAGHAHVEVLRRHARQPAAGMRLTLVARERLSPYSGMLPGLLRGDYCMAAAHIDCARLAAAAGARLIVAAADRLDLAARRVHTAGGPTVAYDLLSIDIGAAPAKPPEGGIAVKPIGQFLARLAALQAGLPDRAVLAVVGGGASGVELAIALALRLRGRARIMLVSHGPPLSGAPDAVRRRVLARLAALGVGVHSGAAAVAQRGGALHLADGTEISAAESLWVTGVMGPPFLAASGLACDDRGCIRVAPTLRSLSHPCVFAAGDCASMDEAALPKAGVWAVRAAPTLARNLSRAVAGQELRPWRPQRAALMILGLGEGRAVAWRHGVTLGGRLAWLWKDHIDRRWIGRYQRLT